MRSRRGVRVQNGRQARQISVKSLKAVPFQNKLAGQLILWIFYLCSVPLIKPGPEAWEERVA